ncbi:MAG: hypothetical protein AABX59_01020 [Nanoarchaeota archaeon]
MEVKEGGIKEEGIKDVDFFKRKGRFKICDLYNIIWKKFSLVEIGQTVPIYDLIWNEETGEVFVGTREYDATKEG